jgi:hypothetical protein
MLPPNFGEFDYPFRVASGSFLIASTVSSALKWV